MDRVRFVVCRICVLLLFSLGLLMLSGASIWPLGEVPTLAVPQATPEPATAAPTVSPVPTAVPTPSPPPVPVANIIQAPPTPLPSPTPVPVEIWKIITDPSALRAGPARKNTCLAQLRTGDSVQLLSRQTEGWLYVLTAQGKRGYVDAGQAEFAGTQSYTLTAPPPEGWQGLSRCVVRTCCDTALRYRPSLDLTDNEIGALSPGETLRVVDVEGLYFSVVRELTGQTGYVLSAALDLAEPMSGWAMEDGIVNFDAASYTYEKMNEDIALLTARYGQWLRLDRSGESVLGRSIPVLRLGGANTRYNILIQASIHGREFATTPLLMEQLESLLMGLTQPGEEGDALRELFNEVAVYAVPMANPDGVAISQWGPASVPEGPYLEQLLAWQQRDCPKFGTKWYNSYFPLWKSNMNGVDLNRNFDARWQYSASAPAPGQLNYKGTAPQTEPESIFLAELLEQIPTSAHLSYHSSGNQIFWYFRQQGELYQRTYRLAGALKEATGAWRITIADSKGSNAGFKDFAIDKYGIPGVTMEIGAGDTPLDPSQYPLIWERYQNVIPVTARWVLDDAAAREAAATAAP